MIVLLKSQLSRLGGAEKITLQMAHAFRKKNYPVTILTSDTSLQATDDPLLKTISHSSSSKMSFRRVQEFDKFCAHYTKEIKTQLIFGLDRNRYQTHLRASNGVHAAYLEQRRAQDSFFRAISFNINPLHRTLLSIEKTSFEHPELQVLFVNSFMVRDEILRFYKTDPKKIQVVHNGVEWQEMSQDFDEWQIKRPQLLQERNLPADTHHFLFMGHNYKRKGLDKLLQALSLLQDRNFHLSVVGKEHNLGFFKQLTGTLGLEHKVTFFGPRSDIRAFYQLADTLVIPSYYDPFANVTVEALAMGLFVVSSKTNGGHEILTSQNGSCIASLDSADLFVQALEIALKNPKTKESSQATRDSVSHLDFSNQLRLFTDHVL